MRSLLFLALATLALAERPHIVLVMTDDQGWGQTGYYDHPHLKTPHLDAMAAAGLRLDRFYAGASNCSPTRATVMTGRTNDRSGVQDHGYPMRLQEKTIAQALRDAGYQTGHFGKWHLNGLRGPGVPILKDDTHSPGAFGFDTWFSVTNFFDMNPLMSRKGAFEQKQGDSSEVSVEEALKWMKASRDSKQPFFTVIWFGSPHSPMQASEEDRAPFADLPSGHQHHLGELRAMDRSIGTLRAGLRELGIAENTLLWFNSDNGGLKGYGPETVGGLRGWKNEMYEGGLRVPCVIEWPAVIQPRVSRYPAGTVDIFPTLAAVAGLPATAAPHPLDGISLRPLFERELARRKQLLFFRHRGRGVVLDHPLKLHVKNGQYELYDLDADPTEGNNLFKARRELGDRLVQAWTRWNAGVEVSVAGKDYASGTVDANQPARRFWKDDPAYAPWAKQWSAAGKKTSKPKKNKKN